MCLLSPQHMAQQTSSSSDGFNSLGPFGVLTFSGFKRTIYYNHNNNLPILFLATDLSSPATSSSTPTGTDNVSLLSSMVTEPSSNLSSAQRKLLHLHQRMGHLHMTKVQELARTVFFGRSLQNIGTCDIPLCKSCLHGKQHQSAITTTTASGVLDALHLTPGDCVSGDQVESSTPGLIPMYRGTPTTDRYQAGTLFVNHASHFLHFTPHISTGGKEAITAKHHFELLASTYNHPIKCYHTDNGIFASKEFRSSCIQQNQHIKFCGVNAHHQNGIAEHHIRTITERAQSMLIHAMISWPDIIQETLWPYALCLAVDLHNCTPTSSGLSPEEIFTGIKGRNRLMDFHPFGCPIFVLDPSL